MLSAAKVVLPLLAGVLATKGLSRSSVGQAFHDKASNYMFDKGKAALSRVISDHIKNR